MSGIAFKPEEARDVLKQYSGQIVAIDYSEKPFGFEGAPEIVRKGKVFGIQIKTAEYEKPQYEWYTPSKVRKTKWVYLIEALVQCGAMRDIVVVGTDDESRMITFGQSMLGMKFNWEEKECESLVREKGGALRKFSLLLPVEYLGKLPIEVDAAVKEATIGLQQEMR